MRMRPGSPQLNVHVVATNQSNDDFFGKAMPPATVQPQRVVSNQAACQFLSQKYSADF
jgi:hypothetical protein